MDAEALLHRFRRQIEYAGKFIAGKHSRMIDEDDARQQAALLTLEYLKSGKIDELQAKADDNPSLVIEQLFQRELTCDLKDWAKSQLSDRKRAIKWAQGNLLRPDDDPVKEVDYRMSCPVLCMKVYDGMTSREIAKELGVSVRTVGRMIAEEKANGQESLR